jgi:small GTP-binding protein
MTPIKIAIIGDGCVGKTCFYNLMSNVKSKSYKFNKRYDATRGFNVAEIEFQSTDGRKIIIHLWDTAGQEKFGSMRDAYLKGADAVICMYDVTNWRTAKNVDNWLRNINSVCGNKIPVMVVGNKIDEKKKEEVRYALLRESHLRSIYGSKNVWNNLISVKENNWLYTNSGYFTTSYSLKSGVCKLLLEFILLKHYGKHIKLDFDVLDVYAEDDF